MQTRKASIKETGEELSSKDWERFDRAVAELKAERERHRAPEMASEPGAVERDPQAVV